MSDLREKVIRLAHEKPELRKHLLPLLKEAKTATGKSQIWHLENAKDLFVKEVKRMGHKVVSVREDTKESRRQVHDDGDERYYITIQLKTEWKFTVPPGPQPLYLQLILKDGDLFVYSDHTIRRGVYTRTQKEMVQVALSQVDNQLYEMASEQYPRVVADEMYKTKTLTKTPDYHYDRDMGVHMFNGKEIRLAHEKPELRNALLPLLKSARPKQMAFALGSFGREDSKEVGSKVLRIINKQMSSRYYKWHVSHGVGGVLQLYISVVHPPITKDEFKNDWSRAFKEMLSEGLMDAQSLKKNIQQALRSGNIEL